MRDCRYHCGQEDDSERLQGIGPDITVDRRMTVRDCKV